MSFQYRASTASAGLTVLVLTAQSAAAASGVVEEIVVTGDLREAELLRTPASVSVIDGATIAARGATHLEDVLNVAPNVNFASGASRARFFQIRGIGERGQFAEPIDPSVGVIVDDVDLSGAAGAATLFDMRQVEVFRGPQSGRYGANAHAGLIVMRSNAPTDEFEARLELDAGEFESRRVGAVVSGPITGPRLTGRVALQANESDGYIDNAFLGRPTAERDERLLRTRLRWLASDRVTADLSWTRVEVDNGYDNFSFESSRNTRSDSPGQDDHDADLLSLRVDYDGDGIDAEFIGAASDSRIDYGYDEDWTFVGFDPAEYSSTDRYLRDRDTTSLELRLRSDATGRILGDRADWLAGLYFHEREVDLTRLYTFLTGPFTSSYETQRIAAFGELRTDLTNRLRLVAGLRHERRDDGYADSEGVAFDPEEGLWGGRAGLEFDLGANLLAFVTSARGYKAGGFNTDGTLDADLRRFDSESVWNHEIGLKGRFANGALGARLALFWMDRSDQQVATSEVRVRGDGSAEFIDFVGNAAEGTNHGLELEFDWAATAALTLSGSLGLLSTEFDDFVNVAGQDLSRRDQAHAPRYQFHLAAHWQDSRGRFARLETEGRDDFYWSDSHGERARAYELVHARAGWRGERVEISVFGRNLTDEDYGVRGFGGFGNDPRNGYAAEEYVQLGEPRIVGVSARVEL
ncbi:MAG: TonB-dependent receptor [Pseudomonadales bacterium]|jgi:outer membrane receptor protein involved in Fe transport|nr:TonB-dependent receptor [Pseudomonadales bacterium]